jgi:hypothetical protein
MKGNPQYEASLVPGVGESSPPRTKGAVRLSLKPGGHNEFAGQTDGPKDMQRRPGRTGSCLHCARVLGLGRVEKRFTFDVLDTYEFRHTLAGYTIRKQAMPSPGTTMSTSITRSDRNLRPYWTSLSLRFGGLVIYEEGIIGLMSEGGKTSSDTAKRFDSGLLVNP